MNDICFRYKTGDRLTSKTSPEVEAEVVGADWLYPTKQSGPIAVYALRMSSTIGAWKDYVYTRPAWALDQDWQRVPPPFEPGYFRTVDLGEPARIIWWCNEPPEGKWERVTVV